MKQTKRALAVLLSLLMAFSVFSGMTFTASASDPEQGSAGVLLHEDFENGFPEGWTKQINGDFAMPWIIYSGDTRNSTTYSGSNNVLAFQEEEDGVAWLITPTLDLSGYTALTLSLAYRNRKWGEDNDYFSIYYRAGLGDWEQLFSTKGEHETWTELKLELPAGALAANVQIGFEIESMWGYGVCLDAVKIANPVQETIEAINAIGTVEYTDASKALIDAAREAYDALTAEQKDLVTNYTTLTDAEAMYASLTPASVTETYTVTWDFDTLCNSGDGDFSKDDIYLTTEPGGHDEQHFYNEKTNMFTAPAGSVFKKIEFFEVFYISAFDFPGANYSESVNYYTVVWEGSAPVVSFDALIYDVRGITFTLERAINPDQHAANVVTALINYIGTVEYSAESKAKINTAREAYDALTDVQKDLVTNYTTLTDAEAAYAALEAQMDVCLDFGTGHAALAAAFAQANGYTVSGTRVTMPVSSNAADRWETRNSIGDEVTAYFAAMNANPVIDAGERLYSTSEFAPQPMSAYADRDAFNTATYAWLDGAPSESDVFYLLWERAYTGTMTLALDALTCGQEVTVSNNGSIATNHTNPQPSYTLTGGVTDTWTDSWYASYDPGTGTFGSFASGTIIGGTDYYSGN